MHPGNRDFFFDLATEYVKELSRKQGSGRVAMTVRVDGETKERLDRIAADMAQSANTVAADLLDIASDELCRALASFTSDPEGSYMEMAHGKAAKKEGK